MLIYAKPLQIVQCKNNILIYETDFEKFRQKEIFNFQ